MAVYWHWQQDQELSGFLVSIVLIRLFRSEQNMCVLFNSSRCNTMKKQMGRRHNKGRKERWFVPNRKNVILIGSSDIPTHF